MTKKDGGPAFPTTAGQVVYSHGMTLRDWLATHADVSMVYTLLDNNGAGSLIGEPHPNFDEDPVGVLRWRMKVLATVRYMCADAMLAARADIGEK